MENKRLKQKKECKGHLPKLCLFRAFSGSRTWPRGISGLRGVNSINTLPTCCGRCGSGRRCTGSRQPTGAGGDSRGTSRTCRADTRCRLGAAKLCVYILQLRLIYQIGFIILDVLSLYIMFKNKYLLLFIVIYS